MEPERDRWSPSRRFASLLEVYAVVSCVQYSRAACLVLILLTGLGGSAFAQFETRSTVPFGTSPYSIAIGNFNRDGTSDMAVVSYLPIAEVSVLLGKSDGTFERPVNYVVGRALGGKAR
jgi:hypothetical protein